MRLVLVVRRGIRWQSFHGPRPTGRAHASVARILGGRAREPRERVSPVPESRLSGFFGKGRPGPEVEAASAGGRVRDRTRALARLRRRRRSETRSRRARTGSPRSRQDGHRAASPRETERILEARPRRDGASGAHCGDHGVTCGPSIRELSKARSMRASSARRTNGRGREVGRPWLP